MRVLTVSQLNRYVKAVLEEDPKLSDLYLRGEISNFTHHFRSGHFYFTLKDESAGVRAVMFRGNASALRFLPEDGMSVLARASVSLYERDGSFQVYVTDLIPEGEGSMAVAVRQRRERLEKLGVFDPARKKRLPPYPVKIGLITSESGAAAGDVMQVLGRRWPWQGSCSAPRRCRGRGRENAYIRAAHAGPKRLRRDYFRPRRRLQRGFVGLSDEELAMALFHAKTPVISAVGHEMDVTICDLAADLRAPTPSAAAELAAPDRLQLRDMLDAYAKLLPELAAEVLEGCEARLRAAANSPSLRNPAYTLNIKRESLDFLEKNLYNTGMRRLEEKHRSLRGMAALLESLSPLGVLARGYALAYAKGKPVRSRGAFSGDKVGLRFANGGAEAVIEKVEHPANFHQNQQEIDIDGGKEADI